jgi:capsular exopolysaccharide synthesis family protein
MLRSSILGPVHAIDTKEERNGLMAEGVASSRFASDLAAEPTEPEEFSIPAEPEERLVSINEPSALGAELLRTLASRLRLVQKRHPIRKLLVTSAVPNEGKTVISANLSITLALYQKRVLLIDGDLRSASLSRRLDIVDDSFESNGRRERPYHFPSLRKAKRLPLWVIPAGKPVELPSKILQMSDFADALAAIERDFDWIVIDSPPLVPFGDAEVLASLSDAVILVTRKGVTPKNLLRDALKSFDKSKIIATILNCADVSSHKYYREYYSHLRGTLPAPSDADRSHPPILDRK